MSNVFEMVEREAMPAAGRRKVIITCAVTGSVHRRRCPTIYAPIRADRSSRRSTRRGPALPFCICTRAIRSMVARALDPEPFLTSSWAKSPKRPTRF